MQTLTTRENTLEYAAILSGLASVGDDVSDDTINLIKENFIISVKKMEMPLETEK